jgi:hypothetical protein
MSNHAVLIAFVPVLCMCAGGGLGPYALAYCLGLKKWKKERSPSGFLIHGKNQLYRFLPTLKLKILLLLKPPLLIRGTVSLSDNKYSKLLKNLVRLFAKPVHNAVHFTRFFIPTGRILLILNNKKKKRKPQISLGFIFCNLFLPLI